jgi:glycosyltransferase involved in cell wall biosynthesis
MALEKYDLPRAQSRTLMLDQITPLVLTFNEAPNIGRTLAPLRWAREVVVVDSLSTDDTVEIASSFRNVRVVQRTFDTHRNQWEFGLRETGIATPWVLALDADYVLSVDLVAELEKLQPDDQTFGFRANFIYCINGKELRSGIYPPVTVLYRREAASYVQDGHTQRVALDGEVKELRSKIFHDDRKSLSHWFKAQARYTELEARKLLAMERKELGLADRLRRWRFVMPGAMLGYCLIARGGILDGWAGFYYAFQRSVAELMLSLRLIEHSMERSTRKIFARKGAKAQS